MISINTSFWPQPSRQGHQIQNDDKLGKKKRQRVRLPFLALPGEAPRRKSSVWPRDRPCVVVFAHVITADPAHQPATVCALLLLSAPDLLPLLLSLGFCSHARCRLYKRSGTCFGSDCTWAAPVLRGFRQTRTPRPPPTSEDLAESCSRLNVTASSIGL